MSEQLGPAGPEQQTFPTTNLEVTPPATVSPEDGSGKLGAPEGGINFIGNNEVGALNLEVVQIPVDKAALAVNGLRQRLATRMLHRIEAQSYGKGLETHIRREAADAIVPNQERGFRHPDEGYDPETWRERRQVAKALKQRSNALKLEDRNWKLQQRNAANKGRPGFDNDVGTPEFDKNTYQTRMSRGERRRALKAGRRVRVNDKDATKLLNRLHRVAQGNDRPGLRARRRSIRQNNKSMRLAGKVHGLEAAAQARQDRIAAAQQARKDRKNHRRRRTARSTT
jgi:hypothetical protein